jgi:flagellar capping protein FliD
LYSGLSASKSVAEGMKNSLVAIGASKVEDGIFAMMQKSFDSLFNDKKTGSLNLYEKELGTDITSYTERQETVQKGIDDRYEIMQKRFQMYDSIIAKMTQQASALTQMINASSNN